MKALLQVSLTAFLGLGCSQPDDGIVSLLDGGPNDPPFCQDGGRCDGLSCGDAGACVCVIAGERGYCVGGTNLCEELIVCPPSLPECVVATSQPPGVGCGSEP